MPRLLRDSWLMFGSQFRVSMRNSVWLFIGLFQPICYMLLFAPLLKNLANSPGFPKGGAYNVFTPGLMIMMAIFGAGFAGFNIIARLRDGVIERLRVTPLVKDQGALAATVNLFVLPLLLLSGIMLPLSLAPDILQNIAKANPFAYAVNAARALVDGHLGDVAIVQSFIIFGVLAILAVFWATRSIRKAAM